MIFSDDDPLYEEAVGIVIETNVPSASLLQRKLKIEYNRASRLLSTMKNAGLVPSRDWNTDAAPILVNDFLDAIRKGEVR